MSKLLFSVGIIMIAYDWAGHFCCMIARTWQWAALIWNAHSKKIWPSIPNGREYDAFWSLWFMVAKAFLLAGYLSKAC